MHVTKGDSMNVFIVTIVTKGAGGGWGWWWCTHPGSWGATPKFPPLTGPMQVSSQGTHTGNTPASQHCKMTTTG